MRNFQKSLIFYILGLLIFLNVLAVIVAWDLAKAQFLEVNFFDVGQGDSIFIEDPQRHQILIDGGPGSVVLEKLAKEMPFWDRTIDLVILTHPERDHISGLIEVLKRYKVENVLWAGIIRDTAEFKEWEKAIKEEKSKIKIAQSGQRVIIPGVVQGKLYLEVLYPLENLAGEELKNSNNASIVSRLIFGDVSFLFTGDVQKSAKKKLTEIETNLNSDVLKISHHGSKNSNSKEFIEKVSPKVAVISVGKGNSYGHPHQEVLDILEGCGIRVLRTDQDGDIKIISDGKNFKIR
jgi:competence protein ComEC